AGTPEGGPADVQRLHGRAGRLWQAGRTPAADARIAVGAGADAVPIDVAGQQQGEVRPGVEAEVRPGEDGRRGVRVHACGGRSAPGVVSGLRAGELLADSPNSAAGRTTSSGTPICTASFGRFVFAVMEIDPLHKAHQTFLVERRHPRDAGQTPSPVRASANCCQVLDPHWLLDV